MWLINTIAIDNWWICSREEDEEEDDVEESADAADARIFGVDLRLVEDFDDGDAEILGTFLQHILDPLARLPRHLQSTNSAD